jgi:selenocysteine-specific elongation factor
VPPRGRVRTSATVERLRRLEFDPSESERGEAERRAIAALIDDAGAAGLPGAGLVARIGVDPEPLGNRLAELEASHRAVNAGGVLVAPEVLARLTESIVTALAEHHRAEPLSDGVPREELRGQLFSRGREAVFDRALDDLARAGRITIRDRVALAAHRVALSAEEAAAREAIERAFRDGGLKPPDAAGIAGGLGVAPGVVDRVLKLLQRQKVLVRLDTLLFHDEALKRLKADVIALKGAGGAAARRIDVAMFKERFGVSRKFAIPLLEYLDRERITRRAGDARVVL